MEYFHIESSFYLHGLDRLFFNIYVLCFRPRVHVIHHIQHHILLIF